MGRWKNQVFAATVAVFFCSSAIAQSFDGIWVVHVVVLDGPCARPPFYRHKVRIASLRIEPIDQNETIAIKGNVEETGDLHATVQTNLDSAEGEGTLVGDKGSGTWSSKTRGCSGTWADRRK